MADILFLAHRVPYPPDRGDKIRSYHILRHLAACHRVHLGAFADDDEDMAHAEALRPLVHRLHVERHSRSRGAALLRGLLTRAPASVAALASRSMGAFVDDVLATEPVDRLYVFSGQMAQYAPSDRPYVMDFVDVDSEKFAQYARSAANPAMRRLWGREATRLRAYEREVAGRAVVSLFVSEAEAALFRAQVRLSPECVQALENGIDLDYYLPEPHPEREPLIVFTGQMDYPPNVEAVTGFARDVLPLIRAEVPAARFAIVGRRPDPSLARLGAGVEVTGRVADVRPWLARAAAVVAPLRLARGIQNKVLEAMAMARPVVASPAAATGIDAAAGEELLVAGSADEQVAAVLRLLRDPVLGDRIGAAARARVEARYGWEARLAPLDQMLSHI